MANSLLCFLKAAEAETAVFLMQREGTGLIAALSGAKVIPAYIDGTDVALPAGAKFISLSKIRIIFGSPIEIKGHESGKDFQERIGNDIMKEIRNLKDKA